MSGLPHFHPGEWDGIELVAFDVDGTLYDQRRLRLQMARELAMHTLRARSLDALSVIGHYRRLREALGEEEADDFEPRLVSQTAAVTGVPAVAVREIVREWIETRPLPHLSAAACAGVAELFCALRRHRKIVGIVSDYPATAKLSALRLEADLVVSAVDRDVRILKPHPRGLHRLMALAQVAPAATLLIGDRSDRDGAAASRAGVRCLIRSSRPRAGWQTFQRFDEALFAPLLAR